MGYKHLWTIYINYPLNGRFIIGFPTWVIDRAWVLQCQAGWRLCLGPTSKALQRPCNALFKGDKVSEVPGTWVVAEYSLIHRFSLTNKWRHEKWEVVKFGFLLANGSYHLEMWPDRDSIVECRTKHANPMQIRGDAGSLNAHSSLLVVKPKSKWFYYHLHKGNTNKRNTPSTISGMWICMHTCTGTCVHASCVHASCVHASAHECTRTKVCT